METLIYLHYVTLCYLQYFSFTMNTFNTLIVLQFPPHANIYMHMQVYKLPCQYVNHKRKQHIRTCPTIMMATHNDILQQKTFPHTLANYHALIKISHILTKHHT
jgi:hypothetical protein